MYLVQETEAVSMQGTSKPQGNHSNAHHTHVFLSGCSTTQSAIWDNAQQEMPRSNGRLLSVRDKRRGNLNTTTQQSSTRSLSALPQKRKKGKKEKNTRHAVQGRKARLKVLHAPRHDSTKRNNASFAVLQPPHPSIQTGTHPTPSECATRRNKQGKKHVANPTRHVQATARHLAK